MTITRLYPSGAWEICAMLNGHLFRRVYYGYTRREAVTEFRADRKSA